MKTKICTLFKAYLDNGLDDVYNALKRTAMVNLNDVTVGKRHISGKTFLKDFKYSVAGQQEIEYPRKEIIETIEDMDAFVVDFDRDMEVVIIIGHDLSLTDKIDEFMNAVAIVDNCSVTDVDTEKKTFYSHILVGMKSKGMTSENFLHHVKHELCHVAMFYTYKHHGEAIDKAVEGFEFSADNIEKEFICDYLPYYTVEYINDAGEEIVPTESFREEMTSIGKNFDEYNEFLDELEKYYDDDDDDVSAEEDSNGEDE